MQLDEFLSTQAQSGLQLTCTLEQDSTNSDRVRVTPKSGAGCGCDQSFTVRKEDVLKIESLNQQIACCGKFLHLARVTLKEKAPIAVEDVVAMMQRSSASTSHAHEASSPREVASTERRRLDCPPGEYPECDPECRGSGERCCVCVPLGGFRPASRTRGGSNRNCEIACSICRRFPWKTGPCSVCDSCAEGW